MKAGKIKRIFSICLIAVFFVPLFCTRKTNENSNNNINVKSKKEMIIKIALSDADTVYKNMDKYNVTAEQLKDGWHVRFTLRDTTPESGGPFYIIDDSSGKIIQKKYYQ